MKPLETPPPLVVGQQSRVRNDKSASLQVLNKPLTTQLLLSPVADSHRWVPEAEYLGNWATMAKSESSDAGESPGIADPIALANNGAI